MKIQIIHQEKDWICVNKPSGLSVHNAEDDTNLKEVLLKQLNVEWIQPVHRLDKETSGLIIFALTKSSLTIWSDIFSKHSIEKKYLGITRGQLASDSGIWNLALTDKGEGRNNPAGIKKNQKECITHFNTVLKNKYFSLVEFKIETGRQHQIRKHCALAKHHLIGDNRYGDKKFNKRIQSLYEFIDTALHAFQLDFSYEGKKITLNAKEPMHWREKLFKGC